MGSTAKVEQPPEMTSVEFDALLVRLYPMAKRLLDASGISRPTVTMSVTHHLWLIEAPETDDTRTLRAHLKYLSRKGYFAFTDFRTEG